MAKTPAKSVDGFILPPETDSFFLVDFLKSPDFTAEGLRGICKSAGIKGVSANKHTLATMIADEARRDQTIQGSILQTLLSTFKEWVAIRKGQLPRELAAGDPVELLSMPGKEKWYGPLYMSTDKCPWYIHPIYIHHWRAKDMEQSDANDDERAYIPCKVRWLCFARVEQDYVSIHWRGLQHDQGDDTELDGSGIRSQVKTWNYIPSLFAKLEEMGKRRLDEVNLHSFVLDYLWENFRYNRVDYRWTDIGLRSRSAGVRLNARSSTAVKVKMAEQEIKGLLGLARTLRRSFFLELQRLQTVTVPNEEHYDDVLLRALIQDFGALSYEFEVERNPAGRLMRFHCYFGVQPDAITEDTFPHIRMYTSWGDHVVQLQDILEHLRKAREYHDQPEQGSLLQ